MGLCRWLPRRGSWGSTTSSGVQFCGVSSDWRGWSNGTARAKETAIATTLLGPGEQEQEKDHYRDGGIAGIHLRRFFDWGRRPSNVGIKELDELESHVNRSRFSNLTIHNCTGINDESCLRDSLKSLLLPSLLVLPPTWVESTWPIQDSPRLTFFTV